MMTGSHLSQPAESPAHVARCASRISSAVGIARPLIDASSVERTSARVSTTTPTVSSVEVRRVRDDELADVGVLLVRAYEAAWGDTGWEDYRSELRDVRTRAS